MIKNKLNAIRKDINEALEIVGEIHGLQFELGKMMYGDNNFDVKLSAVESNGTGQDFAQLNWNEQAGLLGFKDEDYGKVVTLSRDEYRITGVKLKNTKFPILLVAIRGGRRIKVEAYRVREALQA